MIEQVNVFILAKTLFPGIPTSKKFFRVAVLRQNIEVLLLCCLKLYGFLSLQHEIHLPSVVPTIYSNNLDFVLLAALLSCILVQSILRLTYTLFVIGFNNIKLLLFTYLEDFKLLTFLLNLYQLLLY